MANYSGSHVMTVSKAGTEYNGRGTLSVLADGGWLVTWTDATVHYGDMFQQRYDADGNKMGGRTQVETESSAQPIGLSNGGWLSIEGTQMDNGITDSLFFQRYDEDGNPVGASTLVNDYVPGVQLSWGRAAELAGGGSVVTWLRSAGTQKNDIRQQQFDADGNKVGSETKVSSNSDVYQVNWHVTALTGGGWVTTWTNGGTGDSGIYQRVYDAGGDAIGPEQRVQKYQGATTPSYYDAVADKDGGWLLTWSEIDYQTDSYSILRQHYNAQGEATGTLTTTDVGSDAATDIAQLDNGGWAMASTRYHAGRYEVWLQAFDKSGDRLGRGILVDGNADSNNGGGPQLESLDDGRLAVVWTSYQNRHTTETEIQQEIFSPTANHAPIANGEKISIDEQQKVTLDVLANDHDKDGDKLTVESVTVISGEANVAFDEDGRVKLKPVGHDLIDGETATVVVQYTIYDGSEYDTAKIEVTVKGVTGPGDAIHGTAKDDVMNGRGFWEQLFGEDGNDTINGRGGPDILYGGDGDDTLIGGKGNDTFVGGRGDDLLVGGDYDEYDRFVFEKGGGHDTIKNLRNGKVDLSALHEFRDFQDLTNHMHQDNDSLVIDLVGNNSITLKDESLSFLWSQNFIL